MMEVAIGKPHAGDRAAKAHLVLFVEVEARLERQALDRGADRLAADQEGIAGQPDVAHRSGTVELPTFGFSYGVAGQYYSGRFSLMPYDDPRESLLVRMAGRKLLVHYDPEHPEIWFISDAIIEGCKVQQKMGPRLVALYPK